MRQFIVINSTTFHVHSKRTNETKFGTFFGHRIFIIDVTQIVNMKILSK